MIRKTLDVLESMELTICNTFIKWNAKNVVINIWQMVPIFFSENVPDAKVEKHNKEVYIVEINISVMIFLYN